MDVSEQRFGLRMEHLNLEYGLLFLGNPISDNREAVKGLGQ